jgi:hypothetical protein
LQKSLINQTEMRKLQRMSSAQLEAKAAEVAAYFSWEYNAEPVPVEDFALMLASAGKIKYMRSRLGHIAAGVAVLGFFRQGKPPEIAIDTELGHGPRFRFTLAHELGHLALHRKTDVGGNFTDTSATIFSQGGGNDRQWAEWQANNFAAYLLLPRVAMLDIIASKSSIFGLNSVGALISKPQTQAEISGIMKLAAYIAHRMDVSSQTASLRLRKFIDGQHLGFSSRDKNF